MSGTSSLAMASDIHDSQWQSFIKLDNFCPFYEFYHHLPEVHNPQPSLSEIVRQSQTTSLYEIKYVLLVGPLDQLDPVVNPREYPIQYLWGAWMAP